MINLIEVYKEVFVDPEQVVSVEHDIVKNYCSSSPSDSSTYESFNGSRITLKNGRKVFIDGVMPSVIYQKLKEIASGGYPV